ncbi:MAG: 1A family penicillin-binding protein, partial [Parcubacteria group bacterium Gr01-1014_70]
MEYPHVAKNMYIMYILTMYVKRKKSLFWRVTKIVFILGLVGFCVVVAAASIIALTTPIPTARDFESREVVESTKIYDRTGETLLYELYNEEKRTVVPFEEIPRHAKNATIAIEDSHFYNHAGISVLSIIRAFVTDLVRGRVLVQGGSTITQQLVKNTLLTSEKTLTRKIKEAVIALKIEKRYSKDEILNMYLNEIPYGSNAYGIEAAAETYFGAHARDLTLAEAAYLAALPKAPSYYSPYGNHKDELVARKNIVLKRMEELGFILAEERKAANEEQVVFLPLSTQGIRAPHFVMYVVDLLSKQFGEEFLRINGLTVHTTLDIHLQKHAEEVISARAETIKKDFNAGNAGLVALDPKTGEILAMVGSRNYFDREQEGNFNITIARRQPGSAFKPLVYAAAFEKGYTPETVVFDVPTEFAAEGAESYQPQNYDNTFRGPLTLRDALAQSINVPAVKVLYLTGIKEALNMAKRLGISTLLGPNQYGLTLVLGGGEVQLLELVSAYGVFANDGVQQEHTAILRVEKNNGERVWKHTSKPTKALEPLIARMISNILSDNTARAPAFGSASALYFPERPVAAKTGTTNDYRDAWIIGYTPNIAAGVWAGNNDNTPMEKRVAGFIVAPIWRDFMERALKTIPIESFGTPEYKKPTKPVLAGEWRGGTTYVIDRISGNLATDSTPPEFREIKIKPEVHTILHWVDKNDPQGALPTNPMNDSQYKNWEVGVRAWAARTGALSEEETPLPTQTDT